MHPVGETIRWLNNSYQDNLRRAPDNDSKSEVFTKALGNVERCVRKYSAREVFWGKLSGIIYRIWNAFKAIFGQSDWQIARRALKDLMINLPKTPEGRNTLWNLYWLVYSENGGSQYQFKKLTKKFNKFTVKVLETGSKIDNNDLDKILNHFIKVDESKSLRQFLAIPVIQRLMKNNPTSPEKIFLEIVRAMRRLHPDNPLSFNLSLLLIYLINSKNDFKYLKEPYDNYRLRMDFSSQEKIAETEVLVRSIPEYAEFIPILDVPLNEIEALVTIFSDALSKINPEKYQI